MLSEGDKVTGPLPIAAAANPGELVGRLTASIDSVGRSQGSGVKGDGLVGDNRPRPECCGKGISCCTCVETVSVNKVYNNKSGSQYNARASVASSLVHNMMLGAYVVSVASSLVHNMILELT